LQSIISPNTKKISPFFFVSFTLDDAEYNSFGAQHNNEQSDQLPTQLAIESPLSKLPAVLGLRAMARFWFSKAHKFLKPSHV